MFTMVLFAAFTVCNAQLIKRDFMDDIAVGSPIEKGMYTAIADPAMLNQWNRASRSSDIGGSSPLATNPLTYAGYPESGLSNAFTLPKLSSGSRLTGYSLTESEDLYGGSGAYYLAFMIKVNSTTIAGDNVAVITFDGRYAVDYQRGAVCVKATPATPVRRASWFGVTRSDGGGAVYQAAADSMLFETTAFLVLKHDFDAQQTSLYINPSPTGEEPASPNLTVANADLQFIQAITVRQRTNHSCTIGGLRFAKSWASAVGQNNDVIAALPTVSAAEGRITATDYYTISGLPMRQEPRAPGIYIRKDHYENGAVTVGKIVNKE